MQTYILNSALISAKSVHFSYCNSQSGPVISNFSLYIYELAMFDVSIDKLSSLGGQEIYYRLLQYNLHRIEIKKR